MPGGLGPNSHSEPVDDSQAGPTEVTGPKRPIVSAQKIVDDGRSTYKSIVEIAAPDYGPRMLIEPETISRETIDEQAWKMGLLGIPEVADLLVREHESAEKCVEAICGILHQYASLGFDVENVRRFLLAPLSQVPPRVCCQIGNRRLLTIKRIEQGNIGGTYLVAEVPGGEFFILKHLTFQTNEAAALKRIGELEARDIDESGEENIERLLMKYHEGPVLSEVLQLGTLRPDWACWFALSLARQVQKTGDVCHLDIKGDNVIVTPAGAPKLIDWSAAQMALSGQGATQQTLRMSAPEVNAGRNDISQKADVYTLLLLLYEMLSGQPAIDPKKVGDDPQLPLQERLKLYHEYKAKNDPHGDGSGILAGLNTPDLADPKKRTAIEKITEWHAPDTELRDAGSNLRRLFVDAWKQNPAHRIDLDAVIVELSSICSQLGIDPVHGPKAGAVQRDLSQPLFKQVSPQAMFTAVSGIPAVVPPAVEPIA